MNKGVICMVFVSVIGAAAAQGLFEQMAMLSMFSGLGGMGSSSSSTPAGGYQSLQSGYQPKSPGYPTGRSGRQGQQGEQRSQGYNAQSRGNSGLAAAQYPFGLLALSQAGDAGRAAFFCNGVPSALRLMCIMNGGLFN